nr:hypothetical protein CFP56_65010 [Quercus suber]
MMELVSMQQPHIGPLKEMMGHLHMVEIVAMQQSYIGPLREMLGHLHMRIQQPHIGLLQLTHLLKRFKKLKFKEQMQMIDTYLTISFGEENLMQLMG